MFSQNRGENTEGMQSGGDVVGISSVGTTPAACSDLTKEKWISYSYLVQNKSY